MKQQLFETKYQNEWQLFESTLTTLERNARSQPHQKPREFTENYGKICYHLALAKEREYSPLLVDRLNELALRGHQQLYRTYNAGFGHRVLQFLLATFPQAVRNNSKLVLLGLLLFYGPGLIFGTAIYFDPSLAFSFFTPDQIASFSEMYNPSSNESMAEKRGSQEDLIMFGFYIRNNIGIGFQTFASGLLFGLGSLFFLIYNGLAIGGVAGYLTQLGYNTPFYSFVIGHGAFELTAIAIAGAAGMKLGFALIAPGRLTRKQALVTAGKDAIILVYGVILFLLIAAFLEAFWSSSSTIPVSIKYSVGGFFWLLVTAYLLLGGRRGS